MADDFSGLPNNVEKCEHNETKCKKEGEERRKNESKQRAKASTSTLVNDAQVGEEKQNRRQKKYKMKETGRGSPTQLIISNNKNFSVLIF